MAEPTNPQQAVPEPLAATPLGGVEVQNLREADMALGLNEHSLDPSMHYRWVHARPQRLSRLRAKGYQFVEAGEVETLTEVDDRADGRVWNGDCVLMKTTKGRHSLGREQLAEAAERRLRTAKGQFKKAAREASRKLGKRIRTDTKEG